MNERDNEVMLGFVVELFPLFQDYLFSVKNKQLCCRTFVFKNYAIHKMEIFSNSLLE